MRQLGSSAMRSSGMPSRLRAAATLANDEPQRCDDDGLWRSGPPCTYVCLNGACMGGCKPDGLLHCDGLDIFDCDVDGTPVIDVKPFMREFGPRGEVRQPAWATELMARYYAPTEPGAAGPHS